MRERSTEQRDRFMSAMDRMQSVANADDMWLIMTQLATSIGFKAVNVFDFMPATGQLDGLRSSMPMKWLLDYQAQGFDGVDPLFQRAIAGDQSIQMRNGHAAGHENDRPLAQDLADQVRSWGFADMDATMFRKADTDTLRGVAIVRGDDTSDQTDVERLTVALIAQSVVQATMRDAPGATPFKPKRLSPREIDVLSWLATGLRNDAIAFNLGVSEVTVRAHLASARRKLGAATREQAIVEAIRTSQIRI